MKLKGSQRVGQHMQNPCFFYKSMLSGPWAAHQFYGVPGDFIPQIYSQARQHLSAVYAWLETCITAIHVSTYGNQVPKRTGLRVDEGDPNRCNQQKNMLHFDDSYPKKGFTVNYTTQRGIWKPHKLELSRSRIKWISAGERNHDGELVASFDRRPPELRPRLNKFKFPFASV